MVLHSDRAVDVYLVALDERGAPAGEHWGPVCLAEVHPGVFEGVFLAADGESPGYRAVAVARAGALLVSNPVQVVCGAFHVGA